ncbi:hypothetical protein HPP92_014451 [Vanilla planifolia]|uniref:Uncharacterized protein n=1 Tax=Vanilla planifolia TaxID=51239 RepID=A0A835QQZ8_VANPL|nr:hypothetical protein HPP92_014451 [Vanilla planifolia]
MDPADKPPGSARGDGQYASGHSRELQCLDHRRNGVQFLRFQVQEEMVGKIQLHPLGGAGCGSRLHGSAALLQLEPKGLQFGLVGHAGGALRPRHLPDGEGSGCGWLSCGVINLTTSSSKRRSAVIYD